MVARELERASSREKVYYVLGCIQVVAKELAKGNDVPVENCRDFLIESAINYLETGDVNIDISKMLKHGVV